MRSDFPSDNKVSQHKFTFDNMASRFASPSAPLCSGQAFREKTLNSCEPCLPTPALKKNWYATEALPIFAVVGVAVGGCAWYLARLVRPLVLGRLQALANLTPKRTQARGPDVVWNRHGVSSSSSLCCSLVCKADRLFQNPGEYRCLQTCGQYSEMSLQCRTME